MILILLLLVGAAGIAYLLYLAGGLIRAGRRGRFIGDHPHCLACSYDLAGLSMTGRCPECGADVSKPNAVSKGRRVRRPFALVAGVAFAATIVVGSSLAFVELYRSANWFAVAPDFVLRWELGSVTPLRVNRAAGELFDREATGALSQTSAAATARQVVVLQADRSRPWQQSLGNVIESIYQHKHCPEDVWQNYVRNAVTGTAYVRAVVRPGDTVKYGLTLDAARVGGGIGRPSFAGEQLYLVHRMIGFSIGGSEIRPVDDIYVRYHGQAPINSYSRMAFDENRQCTLPSDLAAGQTSITLLFSFSARLLNPKDRSEDRFTAGTEIVSWQESFRHPLTVVARGAENVRVVPPNDPVIAPKMANAIALSDIHSMPGTRPKSAISMPGERGSATIGMTTNNSPAGLAFDVLVRDHSGHEVLVNGFAVPSGKSRSFSVSMHEHALDGMVGETVDVVLRPSVDRARQTIDVDSIWGGEIVFKDVLVYWRSPPFRKPNETYERTGVGLIGSTGRRPTMKPAATTESSPPVPISVP